MGESAIAAQAREGLRLAEAEPQRAVAVAAQIAALARAEADYAAAAIAERAWGLALRHRGDVDSAIGHLREAVRLGRRAGSPRLAAEARITLSMALVERGRPSQALAEIGAALRDLDGVEGARALTQRGTILLELGRYSQAVADYRAALPAIREAGDLLWLRRVVANRGLAHAYRHEFSQAEADLREAERLARQLDQPLAIGFAQANLAFVLATRGDVPVALDYFEQAEQRIREHDAQVGSLLQDRSELLLSVRLVSEAREAAEQAVVEFEKEGRRIKLPEVRLLLARAAFLDGDPTAALDHARRSVREFTRYRRPEWAALARLELLRSAYAAGQASRLSLRRVEEVVAALGAAGWQGAWMEGRLLAAKLLLDRGKRDRALVHLREVSRARRGDRPATLRARAWYAEALLRAETGGQRGVASAIRAGLRVLDRQGAVLGATDLRAYAAGHRTELAEVGLRIALAAGRAGPAFEWAERGRASHLLQSPVRPPEDPQLAEVLAELRGTTAEIYKAGDTNRDSGQLARLLQRQATQERRIRDQLRRQLGTATTPLPEPVRPELLAAALGDLALVEFVQIDRLLYAISMAGGTLRLTRLGPMSQVDALLDRIPFGLHRLRPGIHADTRSAALRLLGHAAERLDELLIGPLPDLGDRPLVVVPTGSLQNLPWSVLPSCWGRPVTVTPSATLWYSASNRAVQQYSEVAVAAGPTLPGAAVEAAAVAKIHGCEPLQHPAATVQAVLASLNGAPLAHLAAHGRLASHNPLFSHLLLSDGPLFVYDLEGLQRPPHTVVLAACDSARSVICTGDELLGLSATFLAHGTTQLVASVVPVLDAEIAPFMAALHQRLADGQSPAPALATVQRDMAVDDGATAATAGFVSLGAGFTPAPTAP
jgi:tetratricopeptide (TPR) repeat protein